MLSEYKKSRLKKALERDIADFIELVQKWTNLSLDDAHLLARWFLYYDDFNDYLKVWGKIAKRSDGEINLTQYINETGMNRQELELFCKGLKLANKLGWYTKYDFYYVVDNKRKYCLRQEVKTHGLVKIA